MKIFFDGDSFTYGGGLENPTKYRWSKLICDHFDAEETNLSKSGVSNECVLRHLFADGHNLEKYDIIFIQLTYPARFECWDEKSQKWRTYSTGSLQWHKQNDKIKNLDSRFIDFMDYYSNYMYNDKQAMVNELIAYNSIVSYLKLLGKPFFMSSLSRYGHINYDLNFHKFNFSKISRDDLHPSILGHKQIAKRVLSTLKSKYEDLF